MLPRPPLLQSTLFKVVVDRCYRDTNKTVKRKSYLQICGVDDEEMQLEGEGEVERQEGEEKIVMGEEAKKVSRDDGVRSFRKLVDPLKPNKLEVDEHDLFHTPYRNWCPICVKTEGKAMDHQKKGELNPLGYSEYSFDYGFPGDEFGFK